jgi:hypothetical protein
MLSVFPWSNNPTLKELFESGPEIAPQQEPEGDGSPLAQPSNSVIPEWVSGSAQLFRWIHVPANNMSWVEKTLRVIDMEVALRGRQKVQKFDREFKPVAPRNTPKEEVGEEVIQAAQQDDAR